MAKDIKTESGLNLFIRMYIQLTVDNAVSTELNIHLSHDKKTIKSDYKLENLDTVNRFIMVTIKQYFTVEKYLDDRGLFIEKFRVSSSNIKVIRELI